MAFEIVKLVDFSDVNRFVDYFGITCNINKGINWICTDDNGEVYGYRSEPFWDNYLKEWQSGNTDDIVIFLGAIEYSGECVDSLLYVGDQ